MVSFIKIYPSLGMAFIGGQAIVFNVLVIGFDDFSYGLVGLIEVKMGLKVTFSSTMS
jgi:hypothetical protein